MKARLTVIGLFIAIVFSCNKFDNSTTNYNQSFTYTAGGIQYTADSSLVYLSGNFSQPAIFAWNKGAAPGSYKIGISLTTLQMGSYSFTPTVPGSPQPPATIPTNRLSYFDNNGNELKVVNGGVNIFSNADYRISGDFTANLVDAQGAPIYLTGRFTDIPIQP